MNFNGWPLKAMWCSIPTLGAALLTEEAFGNIIQYHYPGERLPRSDDRRG